MSSEINKKQIILVGGTGSLGLHFSKYLSKNCKKLIILDLPSKKLEKLGKLKNINIIETDLTKEKVFIDSFNTGLKKINKLDCLINNAALTSEFAKNKNKFFNKFHNYDFDLWRKSIDVTLSGTFLSCREAIKVMIKQKQGSIINISSLYGVVSPNKNLYLNEKFNTVASYSAAKSGVIGLTKWLAAHYGDLGIRTNCISPGGILNNHSSNFKNNYSKLTPLKRMGNPEDITKLIEYLISDGSSYVNGHNFIVDGGYSIW